MIEKFAIVKRPGTEKFASGLAATSGELWNRDARARAPV
jgi:hypothetical protein